MYKTSGQDYEMVCNFLGWMPSIRAIKVLSKSDVVICTGTLLHPEEWRELAGHNGDALPDGRILKIKNVPKNI